MLALAAAFLGFFYLFPGPVAAPLSLCCAELSWLSSIGSEAALAGLFFTSSSAEYEVSWASEAAAAAPFASLALAWRPLFGCCGWEDRVLPAVGWVEVADCYSGTAYGGCCVY